VRSTEQTSGSRAPPLALDTEEGVLLFDPLDVPAELRERASAVVLTCPWHRRDAPQLGLPIYVPPPDPPDLDPVRGEVFRGGDTLPFGVRAFKGFEPNDLVLYVESRRAVVVGDTLINRGNGLEVHREWPGQGVAAAEVVHRLRPLLDLPVDVMLPTHADPADRAALERALSL
jgi:glyoxylase-like metal-dependent hydrolase (beta-lactamase superfamily II)